MKYRVGRKQSRVILDENGNKIAVCVQGNEDVAQQICDLLNEHRLVDNLSQHLVSKSPSCKKCNDELRFKNVFGELVACKDCYEGEEGI